MKVGSRPPQRPANQCDGCMAGMPIVQGIHHVNRDNGFYGIHMACQRPKYEQPKGYDRAGRPATITREEGFHGSA